MKKLFVIRSKSNRQLDYKCYGYIQMFFKKEMASLGKSKAVRFSNPDA